MPLRLSPRLANTVDDIDRNIEYALGLNLRPLNALLGTCSGAVAIVGSGPSLKRTWKRLLNFKGDIMACNASCQFLLERGITPRYMMCFDADPLMMEFITPHRDITYLLASRCPPSAFDMLSDYDVVCWHAAGDENIRAILERRKRMEPMVVGGGAAVTRGMILAHPIGYTKIHIFGGDSSFEGDDTHIRQSTTVERRMAVSCGGRTFWCAPWMACQAEDFKALAPVMRDSHDVKFVVHGDGLIPQIAASLDIEVDWPLAISQFKRQWAWKAGTLWQNL